MRADRLLKLADFLENEVSDKQFNLNNYWNYNGCGAVGCALGWGGICFKDDPDVELTVSNRPTIQTEHQEYFIENDLEFFGLNVDEAGYLFFAESKYGGHITRLQEIELIREFVKNGGIPNDGNI